MECAARTCVFCGILSAAAINAMLPAAGNSNGSGWYNRGTNGNYWSGTINVNNPSQANRFGFNGNQLNVVNNNRTNYFAAVPVENSSPSGSVASQTVPLAHSDSDSWLLEELTASYYCARKNKRNTRNQLLFEMNLSQNLIALYHDILQRRYRVGRSMAFIISKPVKREVFAATFRDRIVHHLLYRYLVPVFEPLFIHDSYACRKEKGTLFGIQRLEHHIRSVSGNYTRPCYVLKMDLSGYFMSIDRQRLFDIIVRTLRVKGCCEDERYEVMEYLLRKVTFNEPTLNCRKKSADSLWTGLPRSKSLFHSPKGCGLPIGNLTSQLFSNIYLNEFDQYVKRTLRCRHYGRYVDDFYVVDSSREHLLSLVSPMRDFLWQRLSLTLHPRKMYLQEQRKGAHFLGSFVRSRRRSPSHRTRRAIRENLTCTLTYEANPYQVEAVRNSYKGYMTHFNCNQIIV